VRDIYTVVRNQDAPISYSTQEHRGDQVDFRPPRFDQVILKYKGTRPAYRNINQEYASGKKDFNPLIDSKGRFKRYQFKEPLQNPKIVL